MKVSEKDTVEEKHRHFKRELIGKYCKIGILCSFSYLDVKKVHLQVFATFSTSGTNFQIYTTYSKPSVIDICLLTWLTPTRDIQY